MKTFKTIVRWIMTVVCLLTVISIVYYISHSLKQKTSSTVHNGNFDNTYVRTVNSQYIRVINITKRLNDSREVYIDLEETDKMNSSLKSITPDKMNVNTNESYVKNKTIVLLTHHGMMKNQAQRVKMPRCYYNTNCEIAVQEDSDEENIVADAVVFGGTTTVKQLPKRLNHDQVFVYFNIESPQYLCKLKLKKPQYKEFFNWTMTYRLDSDIPYVYGTVFPSFMSEAQMLQNIMEFDRLDNFKTYGKYHEEIFENPTGIRNKPYEAIYKKKTNSTVWFVSHCYTASSREKFVSEMKTYTEIDIIGKCSNTTDVCPKSRRYCENYYEENYKFILAFENSVCEDYITEKAFKWITRDIVVVVRGARYYSRYLPKGTYIDAEDFSSPGELAKYLNFLGSNEEEYIKYIKRKDHYSVLREQSHAQIAYCSLCHRLNHLDKYRKHAAPHDNWWYNSTCEGPKYL